MVIARAVLDASLVGTLSAMLSGYLTFKALIHALQNTTCSRVENIVVSSMSGSTESSH